MKDILLEGLSDILYHATGLDVGVKILALDRFKLTSSVVSPLKAGQLANVNLGTKEYRLSDRKFYFGSFARSTRSKYGRYNKSSDSRLMFVIDGRALGQRYRGRPVNYFYSGSDKYGGDFDYGGNFDSDFKQSNDEMEDRLVSDKPYIEGFSKYVKEVRIVLSLNPMNGRLNNVDTAYLRKILILGKKMGIPVRVWTNDNFDSYRRGRINGELSKGDILGILDNKEVWKNYSMNMTGVTPDDAVLMGALVEFFEGRSNGRKLLRLISNRDWSRTDAVEWMSDNIVKNKWDRWRRRVMKLVRDKYGGNFYNFVLEMKKRIMEI